ncbi:MAG TPA: polysaccharide deacetylase family protein [Polyangia bacterium]|nr:polysaccharide deacetylase family protein [Polyangia bacterium]
MARQDSADRICSVSVDLDALACYYRIHALPGAPPEPARFAILRRCLPRFAELFARHGVRVTFFVVGADLDDDAEGRAALAALARAGHELASHSHTHPYDFVRLSAAAIADEIDRAHAAIAACAGAPPVGFRAPGYEISGDAIAALHARGYRYDSSVFPSAGYYGAKAVVMGAMRVAGRKSGSVLGNPRVLFAPRAPYRPAAGAPYRGGGDGILELPIAVTPVARLPVIGTSLIVAPAWLRRRLVAAALREPLFNLELHGIDLCDAAGDDVPTALIARQPDLRRPLAHKLDALDQTLTQVRESGARFVTLADAATAVGPSP